MIVFRAPLNWLKRHLAGPAPVVSAASIQDAAPFSVLHAASFCRGWSMEEFERLLVDPSVMADRAMAGSNLAGFVMSRFAVDEAEILSIAVAMPHRQRGVARSLLDVHLRRLTIYGVTSVFLEVDERNVAARRLYRGFGFVEVGRRRSYYVEPGREAAAALVLRCDLA